MKDRLTLLVGLVVLSLGHGLAQASSECELIKDSDQRNYCRAVSKGSPSWCEFIKQPDLRHRCRALAPKK